MSLLSITFVAIFVATVSAQNLAFTGPSTNEPLNLSSSNIDITWNAGSDADTYSLVDILFSGSSNTATTVAYTLAANLSISSGHYSWNPQNVSSALQNTKFALSESAVNTFMAREHSNGTTGGATVKSGDYKVTGYPYLTSTASNLKVEYGLLAVPALLAALLA